MGGVKDVREGEAGLHGTLLRISSTACSTRRCFLVTPFPRMSPHFMSSTKSAQPVIARPFAIRPRKDLLLRFHTH